MYSEQFIKELECSFFMAFNKCPAFDGGASSMQRRIDVFHFLFTYDSDLMHLPNFSEGFPDVNSKLASNLWRDVFAIHMVKLCTAVHVDPKTKLPFDKQQYEHPKSMQLLKKNMMRDNQDHVADFMEWAFIDPKKSEAAWTESFESVVAAYKTFCGPVGTAWGSENFIKKWLWLDTDPVKGFRGQGFHTKMGDVFTVDKRRKMFVGCRLIAEGERAPRDDPAGGADGSDSD